jgi:hypothetical protein
MGGWCNLGATRVLETRAFGRESSILSPPTNFLFFDMREMAPMEGHCLENSANVMRVKGSIPSFPAKF